MTVYLALNEKKVSCCQGCYKTPILNKQFFFLDYGGGGGNYGDYGTTTEVVTKDGFFHDTTTGK